MQIYTPFLKFKQNEIGGLAKFNEERKELVVPFFDLPRPKNLNEAGILERLEIGLEHVEKHLAGSCFYIDNFDLDDSISLNSTGQYEYIVRACKDYDVIPVVALNRNVDHNEAALRFVKDKGCKIALRLVQEDFESYRLSKPDLKLLWEKLTAQNQRKYIL